MMLREYFLPYFLNFAFFSETFALTNPLQKFMLVIFAFHDLRGGK